MPVLKITDFDDQPIGIIRVTPDSQVQVEIQDPTLATQLNTLREEIAQRPVPLRIGRREEKEGQVSFISEVKACRPGDPQFLNAVRDRVNKLRWEGRRLLGRLVEESRTGGGEYVG